MWLAISRDVKNRERKEGVELFMTVNYSFILQLPLNFFISTISGEVLMPGMYIAQLLSCVSKLVLQGLRVHLGVAAMTSIILLNCFSTNNRIEKSTDEL